MACLHDFTGEYESSVTSGKGNTLDPKGSMISPLKCLGRVLVRKLSKGPIMQERKVLL